MREVTRQSISLYFLNMDTVLQNSFPKYCQITRKKHSHVELVLMEAALAWSSWAYFVELYRVLSVSPEVYFGELYLILEKSKLLIGKRFVKQI